MILVLQFAKQLVQATLASYKVILLAQQDQCYAGPLHNLIV